MRRRQPACGSELAHAPHEAASHHQPDGAIIGVRDQPGWCAGWTEVEAGLCVMLRDVHLAMLENCPPGSSRTFRLECGFAVAAGLNALFRHWAGQVHGAQLVLITGWEPGRWQLAETTPALASGTIRA
jgi:hypothetical protein